WGIVEQGPMTIGKIPFVWCPMGEILGVLEALPPLLDLAQLNIAHWQKSSDLAHITHVSQVPILFASGFPEQPDGRDLVISPNACVNVPNADARLSYVEHSGAAIAAGRQALVDLENQMSVLALRPLVQKDSTTTATETALSAEADYSDLAGMIRSAE